MSRDKPNYDLDQISQDLRLPAEITDRELEKAWRIGEYLVAMILLAGLCYVGAAVFWHAGVRAPQSNAVAVDSFDTPQP